MYEQLKELLNDEHKCSEIRSHISRLLYSLEIVLDLNSEEEWVKDIIFIFDCFRELTIEEIVSLVNEKNYKIIAFYLNDSVYERFLGRVGNYPDLRKIVEKIDRVIMLSKIKFNVTKLLEMFRNNGLEEFLSRLSPDERYGYRNAILLHNYRNPDQTLYTKEELEQIIGIIKSVDDKSFPKSHSPFELAQSDRHYFEHLLPENWNFNRFKSSMTRELFVLDFLPRGLNEIDVMLEFFVIMDVDEIADFISLDGYGNQKLLFESLKNRAHELGKDTLVSKIDCLLDIFMKRVNKPLYDLLDAYRAGTISIFISRLSPDEQIGLKNTILLYDYHNPSHDLFSKEELEKIVEIIIENIREKFPDYPTPLELSQRDQTSYYALTLKLPKGKNWSHFSSDVFDRICIALTISNKKYKSKQDYSYLDTILEFFVIMNIDEIVEFMIVCNNWCVDRTFNGLKERALELGHTELADKIEQSLKEFSSRFKKTIEFYMNIYRRGELEIFARTLALEDKNNLMDFFRLYNHKNPKHSLFSPEELKEFIKIIEKFLQIQTPDNKSSSETLQLIPTDKSVIKPANLLGIYNRKMIKLILSNPFGDFLSDREPNIILDFFEILSIDDIANLITVQTCSSGSKRMELDSFHELLKRLPESTNKIEKAIEKVKIEIAAQSPDGHDLFLDDYLNRRYPRDPYLWERQCYNQRYSNYRNLYIFEKLVISNSDYSYIALVVFDILINSDSEDAIIHLLPAIPAYIKKNYKIEGIPLAYFAQNIKVFEQLIKNGFAAGEETPDQDKIDAIYKQIEDTAKARHYEIVRRPSFKLCREENGGNNPK